MRLPQFIALPALRVSQRLFGQFGFQLVDCKPSNPGIKEAEYYRPLFAPWEMPEWQRRLRTDDPRSLVPVHAKYVLYSLALDATRRCSGDMAECGV